MQWFGILIVLLIGTVVFLIWRVRRTGITGEKARNRQFQHLASKLDLIFLTDGYFIQLEGSWSGYRVIVYPHNFEGPGLVTLIYLETGIGAKERSWIEPDSSLGRALVGWRRNIPYGFEISGRELSSQQLQLKFDSLRRKYPYIAVTPPWRFSYSPLLQKSLSSWENFAVFVAVDAGRQPSAELISQTLDDASDVAKIVDQSVTFSDNTG